MDATYGRASNVAVDLLVRSRSELVDLARPHVAAVRGLSVDEAQLYAIAHGLTQHVLIVAEAMAAKIDRLVDARGEAS